jgi:hypothetical protein
VVVVHICGNLETMSFSSGPSPASVLVARFLRTNNYNETLETFIREAGLPPSVGANGGAGTSFDEWTIEGVIQEKRTFDQSLNFERYGDGVKGSARDIWSVPGMLKDQ